MARAVLMICDGTRADMVTPEWTPNLWRIRDQACVFEQHRSVFPSTTRTTAASIATGCYPNKHGLEGNCVALDDGDGLQAYSVGPAEFRDKLREVTGETLRVPTISERLKNQGGGVVYSNVSPGAAYFHDPDGHGTVYHRAGSYGPGLTPITDERHQVISHDNAGDMVLTRRFVREFLGDETDTKAPSYGVLWICDPDHTQHATPLGSPAHLEALAVADQCAGLVFDRIRELNAGGEDILFLLGADHGHETVGSVLALNDILVEAGFKDTPESRNIVVASNGLSANLYMSEEAKSCLPQLIPFLWGLHEIDQVFAGENLKRLGHRTDGALAVAITTARSDDKNEYGIPGIGTAVEDPLHKDTRLGCGQHGGLGSFEQHPFLMAMGGGFAAGTRQSMETSAINLAPTILRHLGCAHEGMDGTPLNPGA